MAIVPKRKTSKQRKRTRRSHHALSTPNLVNVGGEKVPHRLVKFYKREDLKSTKNK
ncbi:MAG: 50S ribosomal protein L32 [Tenericutes bacterium]|nr:MAG: 50S ribosomal protein L32 [Mycoplasmatota bacterium]